MLEVSLDSCPFVVGQVVHELRQEFLDRKKKHTELEAVVKETTADLAAINADIEQLTSPEFIAGDVPGGRWPDTPLGRKLNLRYRALQTVVSRRQIRADFLSTHREHSQVLKDMLVRQTADMHAALGKWPREAEKQLNEKLELWRLALLRQDYQLAILHACKAEADACVTNNGTVPAGHDPSPRHIALADVPGSPLSALGRDISSTVFRVQAALPDAEVGWDVVDSFVRRVTELKWGRGYLHYRGGGSLEELRALFPNPDEAWRRLILSALGPDLRRSDREWVPPPHWW
jgi:hypothetical protein